MSTDTRVPGRTVWSQLKPLVLRLHFYAGVLIAPFLLIACVTGLLYTAAPTLERVVYADQLIVEEGDSAFRISEQVAAAREAHPGGVLVEVRPPVAPDSSTRVVFTDADVPEGYHRAVFVDPYTLDVLGQERTYGQWLGVRAWLDDLHRTLHLGDLGRHYSELAASWLWVVVLGGLALWVTRRRERRSAAALLLPERGAVGRRRTLSWHASIGVWVALGALMLSVSGLTWSRYAGENIGQVRTALNWSIQTVDTSLDGSASGGGGHDHGAAAPEVSDDVIEAGVGVDGVLAAARVAQLRDPLVLTPPADAGSAWTVAENRRSWPTYADAVAVDGATGTVVDTQRFDDQPFMAKMTRWVIDAHMGILFGVVNQIVLALVALGLIAGVVLGYRAWWQRRPTRASASSRAMGRAPAAGAWRRTSVPVSVGVVVVALAVGWFVPLLGVSLAVFVVGDALIGARLRRSVPAADEHPVP